MINRYITSIEITDTHIKILQATGAESSAVISDCEIREILQYTDAEISKALEEMITSKKIRTDNMILGVPRRFVMLRHLSLPSHIEAEIKKMVDLQAVRQMPYPKEDVVLDYVVIEKEPSGYSKVLAFIVHKEVIERYLKIFNDAHLRLNNLTLSSSGLLSWYAHQMSKSKSQVTTPIVLLNIDTSITEICFFHSQKLLFSRHINFGAKDLTDDALPGFMEQIQLTLSAYQKENVGKDISRVILTSSLSQVSLLKSSMETELSVKVDVIDPFAMVAKGKDLHLPITLSQKGVSLTMGIGLCLSRQDKLINLLPSEVSQTRETQSRKQEWIKFVLLIFLVLGLLVGGFAIQIYKQSTYLKKIQEDVSQSRLKADAIKQKLEQLEIIKKKFGSRIFVVDVIQELYRLTPAEIIYTTIELGEEKILTLQGLASAGVSINVFQKSLVNSSFFENVNLQYATKRITPEGEVTDFKILCRIKNQIQKMIR